MLLNIGNPSKVFELDIDTGSDLTWVQCDVECIGCTLVCWILFLIDFDSLLPCFFVA